MHDRRSNKDSQFPCSAWSIWHIHGQHKNRLTIVSGERRLLQPGLGLLLILFFGFFFAGGFLFLFGGNHGSNILQAIFVVNIHQANALGITACLTNSVH